MLEYIIAGKIMMVPLLIESILALAVVLDRAWAFYRYRAVDNRALRAKVLEHLEAGEVSEAARLCASTPGPVSAVLLAGIQSYVRHKPVNDRPDALITIMEKAMQDYSAHAISAVEKRFGVLSTVGNSAPLLGMLGTVTGMITAFAAMSEGGVTNEAVAAGISEALITTAAGLIVAMIAVIPFNYFSTLSDNISLQIEEAAAELLDFVALRVETAGVTSR